MLAVTRTEDAAAEAMLDGNGWSVSFQLIADGIDVFFATVGTTGVDS